VAQTAHGATRMAQTEVAQRVVAQLGTPHFMNGLVSAGIIY